MRLLLMGAISVGVFAQSAGSLYRAGAGFADLARDVKASAVGDLVTVLVSDRASALAKGTSNTSRKSSASSSIKGIAGLSNPSLTNLLDLSGNQQLQGEGQTSRDMTLSTTITARVIQVTPGGNLYIEGIKDVGVNSEKQSVTLRGLVRPLDLSPANTVRSDQVANLDIQVNGKGVVGDAVRRPHFLYRLLMGLLPF
jgi:flagellar L-ring protein FlgH